MDDRVNILMKLFMCFPSTIGASEETAALMTASYLETLSTFSPSVLAEACDALRKRSTRFAPSAGEIYDRCAEINHQQIQSRKQLPPPDRSERSPEERERMQKKFQALLAELKSSNGTMDEYTPSGRMNPVAERRRAHAWSEKHGAGSDHEVKRVINTSPELEAYLARAFPQAAE